MQTVFVVAANRFFRESLLRLFRSDRWLRVVGTAESSPLIGEQVSRANPQIVALNPEWDDSAFYATRAIHQAAPRVKILMIGMKDDRETFIKAVRAGAVGYLLQDASGKQILAAIHQLAQKSVVCPPHLEWVLFDLVAGRTSFESFFPQPPTNLTPREQQLGSLVAQGLANKEIAERLNLSVQTVKNHVHSILRKTQVKNRSALARCLEGQPSSGDLGERSPTFPAS
jgi:DNA-binding NarL/FixJ family response regulator